MLGSPEITLSILIGSYLVCILLHDYFTKAGKIPTKPVWSKCQIIN